MTHTTKDAYRDRTVQIPFRQGFWCQHCGHYNAGGIATISRWSKASVLCQACDQHTYFKAHKVISS